MSAIGTKQTFPFAPHMSAFGGKADMMQRSRVAIFRSYNSVERPCPISRAMIWCHLRVASGCARQMSAAAAWP